MKPINVLNVKIQVSSIRDR